MIALALGLALVLGLSDAGARQRRPVRLASLEGHVTPLQLRLSGPDGRASGTGDVQLSRLRFTGMLPLPLGSLRTILINRIRLETTRVRFQPGAGDGNSTNGLSSLSYGAILHHTLRPDWALSVGATLGQSSDWQGLQTRDLVGNTMVLVTHRLSDGLTLGAGAGVALTSGADDLLPFPLLLARWDATSRIWVQALLPAMAGLLWAPAPGYELGLQARLDGGGGTTHGLQTVQRVRYGLLAVGPTGAVRLGRGPLYLRLDGGAALPLLVEVQPTGGGGLQAESDSWASWFLRLALELRVQPGQQRSGTGGG